MLYSGLNQAFQISDHIRFLIVNSALNGEYSPIQSYIYINNRLAFIKHYLHLGLAVLAQINSHIQIRPERVIVGKSSSFKFSPQHQHNPCLIAIQLVDHLVSIK
ncbi:hypothetical protein SDC9_197793 [bioreactor metagenome]|uniref:Uncharacterized protein n=1 Tax=bioreactor metagenome TaxID=1076179 RepID=A0A645IFU7_9ZZZZ